MFVYISVDPHTLAAMCENVGSCDVFMLCLPLKIYPGLILLFVWYFKKQLIQRMCREIGIMYNYYYRKENEQT